MICKKSLINSVENIWLVTSSSLPEMLSKSNPLNEVKFHIMWIFMLRTVRGCFSVGGRREMQKVYSLSEFMADKKTICELFFIYPATFSLILMNSRHTESCFLMKQELSIDCSRKLTKKVEDRSPFLGKEKGTHKRNHFWSYIWIVDCSLNLYRLYLTHEKRWASKCHQVINLHERK